MPDQDFQMTYPCYFALGERGFLTVTSDGESYFVLLTDKDLVERFFREKYPDQTTITVRTHTMENRKQLLETLRAMEVESGKHDISGVGIDPSGGKIGRVTLREFIKKLEQGE